MTHVMVDLETYGLAAGCPVLSVGATVVGNRALTFYGVAKVDQSAYGLKPEPATIKYWEEQSEDARKVFIDPSAMDLPVLLRLFASWLPAEAFVWGNGADFDNPILSAAYKAVGMRQPWKPFNGRCYRTIKNLAPHIKVVRQGTHHNALDDALTQAEHMERIVAELGLRLG